MTDQVRREDVAESELLNTLLDAADAPAADAAAQTPEQTAEGAAQPTPEAEAVAPAAEAAEQASETEGAAPAADETEGAAPAAEQASETEGAAPAAEQTSETEAEGASFAPVSEEGGRPRRLKDLQAGMELEGRVTSIALYGIFVDVGVGRDGLVHISEMSDTRIDTPSDLVQIGDTVKVRIKSIDPDARRISLTMRSGERAEARTRNRPRRPEVDKDRLVDLKVGDVVEGTITGFAPFGAFADIGVGKDGLIHVSELADSRVEKPEDAVKVGDRHLFKVIEIAPEGTRISLSLRKALRSQKMQQLEPGQIIDGTVSGIAPFGAFVDIGVGRDGLVHISALSTARVGKVEDVVAVGDKVTVKVLEVDQQSKRISLTMRLDDSEPSEDQGDDGADVAGPITRGARADTSRFAAAAQAARERGGDRNERGGGRRERRPQQAPVAESYSSPDFEEEFTGDATLEDLLSKFGGPTNNRRDRRSRDDNDDDDEGDFEDRTERRQRDAIRRTLQQVGRDD